MKYLMTVLLAVALLPMAAVAETATYYAHHFAGQRMANGKVYLPHKMIAAHRHYRLGTRLKVVNRKTGKSVIVTVSDRCSCSLDLSPAAFKHIGGLRQGRIPVRVAAISG